MPGADDDATLVVTKIIVHISPRRSLMSAYEAMVIALFVVGFGVVRFGVPLLIIWTIRQIAGRFAPSQT